MSQKLCNSSNTSVVVVAVFFFFAEVSRIGFFIHGEEGLNMKNHICNSLSSFLANPSLVIL